MSSNAQQNLARTILRHHWLGGVAAGLLLLLTVRGQPFSLADPDKSSPRARVVILHDDQATKAFVPQLDRVRLMVRRGLTNITAQPTVVQAWRSLVSTQDVVGLKVYSAPGPNTGTRPAVVMAVVESLLEAGLPPPHIVVWDKQIADLRRAGFTSLATRYGIRVAGSAQAGYDPETYYNPDIPFLGPLIWSDLEYGKTEKGAGRKSFVSKLVSQEITKIVNITPVLNHYGAGVAGNLYNLAFGSVDNTQRFEINKNYLAQVVPEIYALPAVGDKVVLNITDALICQYRGQHISLLHYSTILNELRFSQDPVALDLLALADLEQQRESTQTNTLAVSRELFDNAALLELGVSHKSEILVDRMAD